MSLSPFNYGKPIESPERFVGRQREIEQIYSRLLAAGESTSVVGERRTGKTSLLKALAHQETQARFGLDTNKYAFVYQDFQFLGDNTVPTRFWQRVLRAVRRALKDHDDVISEIEFTLKEETIDNFMLDDIFTLIDEADLQVVLLLDEFENVTRNQQFDSDFFGGLRALAIHHNLALITSSRRDLVELTHSEELRSSPFFNIFATINLRSFSEEEAANLIDQYLADTDISFTMGELNVIFAIAGYHCYVLQMACYHLFAAYQEGLDEEARLRYLVDAVRREAEPIFDDYWHYSTPSQQILLVIMTMQELERDGGEDTIKSLEIFYTRAAQVMPDLERRTLVIKNPDTSAYHLFSVEMREWIAEEIIGEIDDLRAWRDWQKDETLVGGLSMNLRRMLDDVVRSLNPKYSETLGKWLVEPATANAALLLVQNFAGRYHHYKFTRPERDPASKMAKTQKPVGDTPKSGFGIFGRVSQRLEGKEPDVSIDAEVLDKKLRDKNIQSLKLLLLKHTGNLNKLLEEAATYGSRSSAPLKLQNDIDQFETTIMELEEKLAALEQLS